MDDDHIVDLYWVRDETAIDLTAQKYGSYCTSIATNILGDRQDAEECVNDAYLQVWRSIPPNRPAVFSAYLGRITRNLSYNRYAGKNALKRGSGQLPLALDELSECVSGTSSPDSQLALRELGETINDFLGTLSTKHRIIFVRRYWYTDSVSQIGDLISMRETAVNMALSRIRKKLKHYLTERGYDI